MEPKNDLIIKNNSKKNKKLVVNNVPSNFRNYISEPTLTFSKTVASSSFLDSYNTNNNNFNTTMNNNFFNNNTEVSMDSKKFNSLEKIKSKLKPYIKQNDLKEFNLKLGTNQIKKKCMTIYKNKYKSKFNIKLNINNDIHTKTLKKYSSYSRFKNNIINKNSFKNNYNIEYNNIFHRSKTKLNIYNYGNKNDRLKFKINSMINQLKSESNEIEELNNKNNFGLWKNKLSNKYNENNIKIYNILNFKERNLKKFNDFAISKLMDINDIKNQNETSFFDYNYNRNYINKRKKDFENNIKLIKTIPWNVKYFINKTKTNKIDDIVNNL